MVGNIGVAVISKALDTQEDDWLVTETSSFQLETTRYFKPVRIGHTQYNAGSYEPPSHHG